MYLAIKPGARCGWAAWAPGQDRPVSGIITLPDDPAALGRTGLILHRRLKDLRAVPGFDRIFYEKPRAPDSSMGDATIAEVARAIGIAAHIESFAYAVNVTARQVDLSWWLRSFVGKGVAERKGTFDSWVRERCREARLRPQCAEEAHAHGILDYAVGLTPEIERPWRAASFDDMSERKLA